jgi:hypothetical protein
MKNKKKKTSSPPEWNASATAAGNAREALPKLAADFFAEGRKAAAEGTSWKDLHAFRLAGKRFRYSLELFRPVFGPGFEPKLKALKQLQDYLGDINDCITVQEMVEGRKSREAPSKAQIVNFLTARAGELTEEFRRHWTDVFDAEGQEKRWTVFLARSGGGGNAEGGRETTGRKPPGSKAAAARKRAGAKRPPSKRGRG